MGKTGWALTLGLVAIVFNPLVPVRLGRETWAPVDVAAGLILLASIPALRIGPALREGQDKKQL